MNVLGSGWDWSGFGFGFGFGLYQYGGDRGIVGRVSVFGLRWCGWCWWGVGEGGLGQVLG